jgi:hypothetical protein
MEFGAVFFYSWLSFAILGQRNWENLAFKNVIQLNFLFWAGGGY